mmetsp:Transcript_14615/g.59319  ORF Transcript_14615/g.59319 Transcript_14615/m.59319 type:complete len:91 (-) Transcript_14615:9686-9958(-)
MRVGSISQDRARCIAEGKEQLQLARRRASQSRLTPAPAPRALGAIVSSVRKVSAREQIAPGEKSAAAKDLSKLCSGVKYKKTSWGLDDSS